MDHFRTLSNFLIVPVRLCEQAEFVGPDERERRVVRKAGRAAWPPSLGKHHTGEDRPRRTEDQPVIALEINPGVHVEVSLADFNGLVVDQGLCCCEHLCICCHAIRSFGTDCAVPVIVTMTPRVYRSGLSAVDGHTCPFHAMMSPARSLAWGRG